MKMLFKNTFTKFFKHSLRKYNLRLITFRTDSFRGFCSESSEDKGEDDVPADQEYEKIVPKHLRFDDGQGVFLIQPRIRFGADNLSERTTPELQLAEGVALIETIDNWKVLAYNICEKTACFRQGKYR